MTVESQLCPQCGSAIQFEKGKSKVVCAFCGTTVVKSKAPATDAISLKKEIEADKLGQEVIDREIRLHTEGRPATAKILTAQSTGIMTTRLNGKGMLMSFTVEVQPEGEAPFNAETKVSIGLVAIDKYQPGTVLDVRYDPQDHTQVSVEGRHGVQSSNPWLPDKQERKADEMIRKGDEMIRKADEEMQQAEKEYNSSDTENDGSVKAWKRLMKGQSQAAASDTEKTDEDTEDKDEDTGDTDEDKASTPAWGEPRKTHKVPVPDKFNPVTDLGPAIAAYRHHGGGVDLLAAVTQGEVKELVRYQDGMAYITRGKGIHTWRWSEVATILTDISVSYPYYLNQRYTLLKGSGEKLILDEFLDDVENLIQSIKNKVYTRLYPPLKQCYDAGQPVTFGPVTVQHTNGLAMGGKTYAWAGIIEVKVENGRLTVRMHDDHKHEAHTKDIPNVELLCKLIGVKLDSYDLHA